MKSVNLGYWGLWQSRADVLSNYASKNDYKTYLNKWFTRGIIINGVHLVVDTFKVQDGDLIVDFKIDNDVFHETK